MYCISSREETLFLGFCSSAFSAPCLLKARGWIFMHCLSGTLFPEFLSHIKAPVNYTQSSRIIRENSMSRAPDWQSQFYLSPPFPLATFKGNLKTTYFIRASAFHRTHSLTRHRTEAYQLPHRHSQKENTWGYSEEKKVSFIWVMENIGRHLWTVYTKRATAEILVLISWALQFTALVITCVLIDTMLIVCTHPHVTGPR